MSRLRGRRTRTTRTTRTRRTPATTTTTTTTKTTRTTRNRHATTGVAGTMGVHHKRRASFGDKVSGAMMRLRGSLTRRPGLKAAGTRRMHGTDGRGSHTRY
ncbi:hypothetical protein K432DRAFT_296759 [Lepidopterella palustris CBS 459.81]|uniref:Uncharacterized protein n=1 Tax=Lepidopterella palustris CBS 459.81 TaxID=1314670 RepID=A0A8E2EBW0_9PEZI|nr:hypothetical protein K432DRAFT_296759 [Lepidopterella palustris CBS 459.81]